MKSANTILLEPIMNVEVVTDDINSSTVLSDFGRRRGSIQDITTRSNNRVIHYLYFYLCIYYYTRFRIKTVYVSGGGDQMTLTVSPTHMLHMHILHSTVWCTDHDLQNITSYRESNVLLDTK